MTYDHPSFHADSNNEFGDDHDCADGENHNNASDSHQYGETNPSHNLFGMGDIAEDDNASDSNRFGASGIFDANEAMNSDTLSGLYRRTTYNPDRFPVHDMRNRSHLPCQEVNALRDFVNGEWLHYTSKNGPTFLWNRMLPDISAHDDLARSDCPVAPYDEVRSVMMAPIEWYFEAVAATTASATVSEDGYEVPHADMPTFHIDAQILGGVQAVVGNAMMSNHWEDAARNLTAALDVTAMFVANIADRDGDGFEFMQNLLHEIRIYFDALARNADPATSERALDTLTDVAYNEDFQLNPVQMIELLSCTLSFAQWDDTRVFAYDAVDKAEASMDTMIASMHEAERTGSRDAMIIDGDGNPVDNPVELVHTHFKHMMLFLRHDLLRISAEQDAADGFLREHHDWEPFADSYAARLVSQERWEDLLDFIHTVTTDNPNQALLLVPAELAPYEWNSMREAALEALGRRGELCDIYRERIVEAYQSDEIYNVRKLKAASGDDWHRQVSLIVEEYANGCGRFTRNMAYEQLMINEQLGERAWQYCLQFPKARTKLAKTIATAKPEKARRIILGPVGLDGSYEGELPARLAAYQRIGKSLTKYASVFTDSEAREIADKLIAHYPNRQRLADVLHRYLD